MTIRYGLLGCGRIGKVHAQAISQTPGTTLTAVFDPMQDASDHVTGRFGGESRELDAIIDADDIDAVLICTPTDTHADLIERAARAGKAIFCEKPIDLSVARVKQCLAVVEKTGATLMIGFNRRFDPDFMALKDRIDAGAIGKVEMVTLTSRDPSPPPLDYIGRSGGIFRDMTIHDFDVARWFLGEEVTRVQAAGSVLVDPAIGEAGDFDSANVILTTESGRQCTITNSRRASFGYDQRAEVMGSEGAISLENRREANIELANAQGYTRPPLLNFFMTRYVEAYAAEMQAFAEALTTGTAPRTGGHDGLMALVLAEAATRAAREQRVVAVSEILEESR